MIIDHIKHIGFYEPMAVGITAAWKEIQQMLQEKGEIAGAVFGRAGKKVNFLTDAMN